MIASFLSMTHRFKLHYLHYESSPVYHLLSTCQGIGLGKIKKTKKAFKEHSHGAL